MDILYVHPAKQEVDARYDQYVSSSSYPYMPVGVVGLVNMLRECGWVVQGLNLPIELTMRPTFRLERWLRDQPTPGMVMVDLHWYEHCYGALDVARAVKEVWPRAPVVLGGLTATRFASLILDRHREVDLVVCGDAEEPLRLLAERCCGGGQVSLGDIPNLAYREGDAVRVNPTTYTARTEDLERLDFVETGWLQHWESYAALQYSGAGEIALRQPKLRGHWLTIGRGCTFNCSYCGGGKRAHRRLAGRKGYVQRTPEGVVADIARLKEKGYHQVSLSLDPATFAGGWWQDLFRLLGEWGGRIGLYNEFFQLPSDEFLQAFVEVADLEHSEVALSPLSGDEGVRRRNGKFFSNVRLMRTLDTLKMLRIPLFVYFSLNLPGETPRAFERTLELARRIGELYPPELLRMLNSCHTLDPVSPMGENPKSFGIRVQYRTFEDYYTYCKGTGWQPRLVTRGEHRGFDMPDRPAEVVEEMARRWDAFAEEQPFRCAAIPRGW